MKGDFSRRTFDPANHFSQVLLQQGRVLLDADVVEQIDIFWHHLRTVIADFSGPVAPIGNAFQVSAVLGDDGGIDDLRIALGHLYVDGILCEQDDPDATYLHQPDLPLVDPPSLTGGLLVYVDAWERHLTHVQHPLIREVALGGPDSTTRARIVWQVKVHPLDQQIRTCDGVATGWDELVAEWQPPDRGMLAAAVERPDVGGEGPCVTAPDSRYRGGVNRLYRVEVHSPGAAGEATFVWSRENGSVVFPIVPPAGEVLQVETLGSDEVHDLDVGDWVEVIDDHIELRGEPGALATVNAIDPIDRKVELSVVGGSIPVFPDEPDTHPILRRWDYRHGVEGGGTESEVDGALVIEEGVPIRIEHGIVITFKPAPDGRAHRYRTGDHWLIPARVATGDIEWPHDGDVARALPPLGVDHHYGQLAVIAGGEVTDCLAGRRDGD